MMDTTKKFDATATKASETPGAGTATVGSVEKQGTTLGRKPESATVTAHVRKNGDAAAKTDENQALKSKTINISILGEAELWSMIQLCVIGMNAMKNRDFAANTQNVHKELRETLTKTCMLLTQYNRVKNQGSGDTFQATTSKQHTKGKGNNVATQTSTIEELSVKTLTSTLVGIQNQLIA